MAIKPYKITLITAVVACLAPAVGYAEVRLPHILSDHMVLQAGQPLPVWGWADPGETITVRFAKQVRHIRAGSNGHWQITLTPVERSDTPQEMKVSGAHSTLDVRDVLVGEVWLASGQSNMEKPVGDQPGQKPTFNAESELAAADHPDLRLFKVKRARSDTPAEDVEGEWVRCDPTSLEASKFSAAGYFFGRKLQASLATPVGMIDSTWGGTRIELWTPGQAFATVPTLTAYAEAAKTPGKQIDGTKLSTLYNAMVAPLVPYRIKGLIWYQGESNLIDVVDGSIYADKMTALVDGWRAQWGQMFPVYYVQIAPYLYHLHFNTTVVSSQSEPVIWEAQSAALRLPKTGMVVTTDLVDDLFDIHPRDKKTVGERLANLALSRDYGQTGLATWGPVFAAVRFDADKAILRFDHAQGLTTRDKKTPDWFTIAGPDGVYYAARATIDGDRIIVSSPHVAAPVHVRFAWDEGAQPNLINGDGLPASPFRTDNPFGAP